MVFSTKLPFNRYSNDSVHGLKPHEARKIQNMVLYIDFWMEHISTKNSFNRWWSRIITA